jgi:Arc/MetJ-type ribon-helix-helix transcriptional regulator
MVRQAKQMDDLPEPRATDCTFLMDPTGSIIGMKVSVSLRGEDVEFLDAYAAAHEFPSRSAVLQQAIRVLRMSELADDYGAAWSEWSEGGEAERWEPTTGDGL